MMRTTRACSAILALLMLLFSAFPAFAEGGNGDGTGDGAGRENPLTLASSSVPDGAQNVDPNVHVVLTFTKNVVHFNVKENNLQCFSVTDSQGNAFPIRVVMGDDQVDPEAKRIVTIVPQSPYQAGETYTLTVKKGLTAKNEENVLEEDVNLRFTIRAQTTVAATSALSGAAVAASPYSTTTTTKRAETTTKRVTTTRPPITAAARATTAAPTTTEPVTAQSTTAAETTSLTLPPVTEEAFFALTTTVTASEQSPETTVFYAPETEAEPVTEQSGRTETQAAPSDPESHAEETQPESAPDDGRVSPAICIGIIAAVAAAIAVVCIIQSKKQKG